MASKQITVGIGIPMIVTGFLIAIFWAPLVGDVKETVEFIGSLIGIIGVILFIAGLFYTKQPVAARSLNARIFEIFTSIEGEGRLYGTKTLFVRFAGCPYSCFYCVTLDALPLDSGKEYSITEACNLIDSNLQDNTFKVNFTGGEPLIQHEAVSELAKHVKARGLPTYLESACFDSKKFLYVLPSIDFVKIEFKTIESEFIDEKHYPELLRNTLECLQAAVEAKKTTYIKIVVSSKTEPESFKEILEQIFKIISKENISGFIIQPTTSLSEPTLEQLLEFYDLVYPYYDEVRVVPQLHKVISAP